MAATKARAGTDGVGDCSQGAVNLCPPVFIRACNGTYVSMNILGITFGFHESAACLVQDGKLVFACAEERLSRKKQDSSFPVRAIQAALDSGGLKPSDVDHVAIGWP